MNIKLSDDFKKDLKDINKIIKVNNKAYFTIGSSEEKIQLKAVQSIWDEKRKILQISLDLSKSELLNISNISSIIINYINIYRKILLLLTYFYYHPLVEKYYIQYLIQVFLEILYLYPQ